MLALAALLAVAPVPPAPPLPAGGGTVASHRIAVAPAETLAVQVSGRGPAVLLVPGLLGGSFGYRKVVPLLVEGGYQAVVVEPLGIGGSSRPREADYSMGAQARRIAAVLDTLGLPPATVVAHSVGASIAFRLALHRPDRVAALVSINGGPVESAGTPGLRKALKLAGVANALLGSGIIRKKLRGGLLEHSVDTSWVSREVVQVYAGGAEGDAGAVLGAFKRMARAVEADSLRPRLHEVRVPILLVRGHVAYANSLPEDEVVLMRAVLPRFDVLAADGAGEYVHEEQPAVIVDAVRRVAPAVATATTPG